MRIAFRVDASRSIGFGHLVRCLALAEQFRRHNEIEPVIITSDQSVIMDQYNVRQLNVDYQNYCGSDYLYENIDAEVGELIEVLLSEKIDVLIVDHYGVTNEYFDNIKNYVKVLVYIDDLNREPYNVDVIVNGNCYADEMIYSNKIVLTGTQHCLLRDEFRKKTNRTIRRECKKIYVTSGGSDPLDFTVKIIELLKPVQQIAVGVIIGKGFTNEEKIIKMIHGDTKFFLCHNVNMKEAMEESDLFITSSGSILYELAVTGTPSISYVLSFDQKRLADKMHMLGTTYNNKEFAHLSDSEFYCIFNEVSESYSIRKEMSINGKRVVDGLGCYRVYEAIVKYYNMV